MPCLPFFLCHASPPFFRRQYRCVAFVLWKGFSVLLKFHCGSPNCADMLPCNGQQGFRGASVHSGLWKDAAVWKACVRRSVPPRPLSTVLAVRYAMQPSCPCVQGHLFGLCASSTRVSASGCQRACGAVYTVVLSTRLVSWVGYFQKHQKLARFTFFFCRGVLDSPFCRSSHLCQHCLCICVATTRVCVCSV